MSRIALDLRMVQGPLHGIARYALELARRLPAAAPHHAFVALRTGAEPLPLPPSVEQVRCRRAFLDPREQFELLGVLATLKPDLVHWTSFSTPALALTPSVITLHDANHLAFPEHYGPLHGLYYRSVVLPAARRARRVITVSRFAARELHERLGLALDTIAIVPNGIDPRFRPASTSERAAVRARLELPESFVLFVGNLKPHKNVALVIEAARQSGLPLLAVVPRRPEADSGGVLWRDDVQDAELPALYSAASVFAFPSRYEGFGLPPLEALACGTPVVASNAASLPEVLGGAARLLDPDDAAAWAAALREASGERSVAAARRGREQAARFTWDATAAQTLALYERALAPR